MSSLGLLFEGLVNGINVEIFALGTALGLNGQMPVALKPALSREGVTEWFKSLANKAPNTLLSAFEALVLILYSCNTFLHAVFTGT